MTFHRPPARFQCRCLCLLLCTASATIAMGSPAPGTTIEIYYAPEDAPLDRLLTLYGQAKQYIYVAVYGFTSPKAVEALALAKKRGLDVRLITDQERMQDPKQRRAVHTLQLAGVPVKVGRHDGLMHLKQVVIDDRINTSGSMNHTTSGNRYNDERLDIVTDHGVSVKAREKFLSMWNDADRYRPWSEE
ncbi:MAG TPA: phospholipase D-like domain-containing protein [Nitrospira sp.]|nr:phospholipase D-like domain-containing protein [Nitrospira sp.]